MDASPLRDDRVLRVLFLEDTEADAELAQHELRKADVSFEARRAQTEADFRQALATFRPDVILADYAQPGFTALDAFRVMQGCGHDAAFILFTGSQSERVAVECMKAGVDDYVLKSDLARLPAIVRGALRKREGERRRIATEASLRRSEERYRLITEHARDLICIVDSAGKIHFASPSFEKVLGFAARGLVGSDAARLVHPEDRAGLAEAAQRARDSGEEGRAEFRCRHRDGGWRIIEAVGEWVPMEAGQPDRAVVVARDVTRQRDLERQSGEARKMEAIRRLAAGIAHDFNNLLTVIKGHGGLLLDLLMPENPLRAHVEEIKQAADRAAALTRQLIAFSRQQTPRIRDVELGQWIASVEPGLRGLLGEQIRLVLADGAGPAHVRVDPDQMEQLIRNLVVNARDAMPQGGTLSIETAHVEIDERSASRHVGVQPGAYVTLTVRDSGEGMDEETQSTVFEPFFTTKETGKGSGLGLSVVYGIARQNGGTIALSSAPGKGTEIRLYLPRLASAPEATQPAEPAADGREPDARPTVLLVEDDEPVLNLMEHALRRSGYAVLSAKAPEAAIRACREHTGRIDLLVSDVIMPGLTGPDLSERLLHERPEMRILFVSGYADRALIDQGLLDPAVAFLQKPFTLDALTRRVADVLAGAAASVPLESPTIES